MAFSYNFRSRQFAGVGSVSDSSFYTEWALARSWFPRMCLHREWDSRECYPRDVVVPTEGTSRGDSNDSGFISDLDFSPSGRLLVASSSSNSLFLLDPNISSRDVVKVLDKPHGDAISKVRFVSDYQFVSGSADSTISYWDIRNSSEALNFLRLHQQPIRSLQYFPEKEFLISSCQEGIIRFWHLPSFSVKREQEESPHTHGILLKCPNLRQCYFSESEKLAAFSNNFNTLFTIHNLDIEQLKEDLSTIIFDESLSMQLCWIRPNAMPNRRNRVKTANNLEYSPLEFGEVSRLSHLSINKSSVGLLRLRTSYKRGIGQTVKEWTCVCKLKEDVSSSSNPLEQYVQTFGSNVIYGMVLYAKEELVYSHFNEKHPSLSLCSRVIASPDKHGVQLLKFSPEMDTCLCPRSKKKHEFSILYEDEDMAATPSPMELFAHLPAPEKSVLCCKFSPVDQTLLAVGDTEAKVKFFRPKY